jgi:hypothetical protein
MYDAAKALQLFDGSSCSSLSLTQGNCSNAYMDGETAIDSTDVVDIAKKAMNLN